MNLEDRARKYKEKFPNYPDLRIINGRIEDLWFLGQDYRNTSNYYGAYPANYLKRINALFGEKKKILHLFSGRLSKGDYTRFDVNMFSGAEVIGEAERLSEHFEPNSFDLILADPPYSQEDAVHYGVPLISRNKVHSECHKILEPGGHLVWLDQAFPMFSKRNWILQGAIGIVISTNHRIRATFIWEKK